MRFFVEGRVPILASGAAVFVLSALAWTVGLPPHRRRAARLHHRYIAVRTRETSARPIVP